MLTREVWQTDESFRFSLTHENALSACFTALLPEQPSRHHARIFDGRAAVHDDADAGIWEATPGKWHVSYDEWEYFHILEGHSILTEEGGEPIHLRAGDRLVVKPGFNGSWEVVETTRKDYVIRL